MNARKEDCYDGPPTEAELERAPWYRPPGMSRRQLERELGIEPDDEQQDDEQEDDL